MDVNSFPLSEKAAQNLREFHASEAPVVRDLNEAGFGVASTLDLLKDSGPYPEALPILLGHLEGTDLISRVRDVVARCLAVPDSSPYWDRLLRLYLTEQDAFVQNALALSLSNSAREENTADLLELLGRTDRGASGTLLLPGVLRVGGDRGRTALEALSDHPTLGKEAQAQLRRKRPQRRGK